MNMKLHYLFIAVFILLISSCNSYKKVGYLKGVDDLTMEQLSQNKPIDTKIKSGDIITINVNTVSNTIAAIPFNLPLMPVVDNGIGGMQRTVGAQAYVVDPEGKIEFPVIGKISVVNKTRVEVEKFIQESIYPQYITEKPIVTVRYLGYQIYVLGEVNLPGVHSFSKDKVNLLEALATAGDLTIYGKRDNILLRREHSDGTSEVVRLNLQDKDLLLSPYFYLQQNDILYVEPNKAKGNSGSIGATENITISVVSILVSVATLLITVFKN